MDIVDAVTTQDLEQVRRLFVEYETFLNVDLCFQNYARELAGLPGDYAAPAGALLLARNAGVAAGCVAMRPLGDDVCEMKRLFVRPTFRGTGLGRRLADASIERARKCGYRVMRLDTLQRLTEAVALYSSMGFRKIDPYYHNPLDGVVYLELQFDVRPARSAAHITD